MHLPRSVMPSFLPAHPFGRLLFRLLLAVALVGCAISAGQAQRIGRSAAAYVEEGDALRAEGKRKEAIQAYRSAMLADRDDPLPYRRLGELAAEEEDWGEVRKRYNRVLKLVPDDLDGHYYVGIADREIGLFRPPFVQDLIEWRRARKHFESVLERDSTHRDVLYQFAVLRSYQGGQDKWREALTMARTQLDLRDDLVDAHVGLFRLYQRFLSRWHDANTEAWLRGLDDDHATFAAGEALRLRGEREDAEAHFRAMLARPLDMPRAPIHLALARLYAGTNRPDSVTAHYRAAVEAIEDRLTAALVFEDTKYIIDDAELAAYRALETPEDYRQFFRALWASRNPLPAAETNPRLVEHYRRLREAERSYLHYGLRAWFNNPDKLGYLDHPEAYALNHQFNDKGLIYIRHGRPDERAVTVGGTSTSNESWRYYPQPGRDELIFHFTVDEQSGGGANWRLTPVITDRAILSDLVTWGNLYQRLFMGVDDALERQQLELEMGELSRRRVMTGLTTDRHTWRRPPAPLAMPYQVNSFRGEDGLTDVEIAYMLPLGSLAEQTEGRQVVLETGLAVHDSAWAPVVRKRSEHRYAAANRQASDMIFGAFYFSAPPDSYHVALHAEAAGLDALAGWKFDEALPDFSTTDLNLSDLLLAYVIRAPRPGESNFVRDDQYVLPNPTLRFATEQPVFVFFEVYNLILGADDRSAFTVEYTLMPVKEKRGGFLGLFRRTARPALSLSFDREADGGTSTEYAGIDVSAVEPGAYRLEVTVTDKNAPERTFTRSRTFLLAETPSTDS